MQGLNGKSGAKMPKSVRPTKKSGTSKRRYGSTLAGITAPAFVAAMVTGALFNDRMPKPQPELGLADRVNMLRAAQDKRDMPYETLTGALAEPFVDAGELIR